jgi:hypothetical protein
MGTERPVLGSSSAALEPIEGKSMFTRASFVVFGACAALMLSSSATGSVNNAGKGCLPISIRNAVGTFTYVVRIEAPRVRCGLARAVVRDAADWPPGADEGAAAAGWHCTVGQEANSWALSCARRGAIVRAYGPVPEHNPWVVAEARLRIGLFAPTPTFGLALVRIRLRPCGALRKWLEADYVRADGATLTVAEGKPDTCSNLGLSPLLSVWHIHGSRAPLVEFCAPTGCARIRGDYALGWRDHGLQVALFTHALSQRELLTIARGMTAVPA